MSAKQYQLKRKQRHGNSNIQNGLTNLAVNHLQISENYGPTLIDTRNGPTSGSVSVTPNPHVGLQSNNPGSVSMKGLPHHSNSIGHPTPSAVSYGSSNRGNYARSVLDNYE